jgi:hypothetical protein
MSVKPKGKKKQTSKAKALMERPKASLELQSKGGWHSFQYTVKDAMMIIEDFKDRYNIKPQRGHLMIVERQGILTPYITKSGHAAIANENKIKTKIVVDKMSKGNPIYAMVKCTAILPDGTSHEAVGYSDNTEPGRNTLAKCISMATVRARNNAIDMAMEIQPCGFDDFNEGEEIYERAKDITELQKETLAPCPECKKKGWSKLQKKCMLCAITYEDITERNK